jgi:drug/metabolite transporter (DMT)-like permease
MQLLYAATGTNLLHITLAFSALLAAALCIVPLLLRVLVRDWRMRMDGVILLVFMLLVVSMFLPQLFFDTPPPTSDIRVNWPAAAVFACIVMGVALLSRHVDVSTLKIPGFTHNPER